MQFAKENPPVGITERYEWSQLFQTGYFQSQPQFPTQLPNPVADSDTFVVEDSEESVSHGSESDSKTVTRKRGRKPKTSLAISTGNNSNTCDTCGKSFTAYSSLLRHEITHQANPKRFSCDICGEKFTQKPSLVIHNKRKHLGEFNFPCSRCGKKFVQNKELQDHMKVHKPKGNVEKFPCRVCGKNFAQKKYRRIHELSHDKSEDGKKFMCIICHRRFYNSQTLNRHEKDVHDPDQLPCPHCPVTFKRARNLKYHIQLVHLDQRKPATLKSKYCEQMFVTKSKREMHEARHEFRLPEIWNCMLLLERNRKHFRCVLCPSSPPVDFPTSYLRDQHKKTVHPELQLVLKKIAGKNISLNPDDPTLMEVALENGNINLNVHWNHCLKCGRAYLDLNLAIRHNNFCTATPKQKFKSKSQSNSEEIQQNQAIHNESLSTVDETPGSSETYDNDDEDMQEMEIFDEGTMKNQNHKIPEEDKISNAKSSQENQETANYHDDDSYGDTIEFSPRGYAATPNNETEDDQETEQESQFQPPQKQSELPSIAKKTENDNPGTCNSMDADLDLGLVDDSLDNFSDDAEDGDAVNEEREQFKTPAVTVIVPSLPNPKPKRIMSRLLSCVTPYEKEHINIILTAEKPFQCKTCLKFYPTKSLCKTHIKAQHEKPMYQCEYCGKDFTVKTLFEIHVRVKHTGEKPWKCTECNYSTAYQSNISIHRRKHTGEKPYKCTQCSYSSPSPVSLYQHKRCHQTSTSDPKEKNTFGLTCTFCKKTYLDYKYFTEHMNAKHTHKNEYGSFKTVQPYTCTICGAKFGYTSSAHLHIRTKHKSQVEEKRKSRPENVSFNALGVGVMSFCIVDKNLLPPPKPKAGDPSTTSTYSEIKL